MPLLLAALIALGSGLGAQTFTSNPGATIPDGSRTGVTDTITVGATGDRIRSFRLDLRINHNEVSNLDIYLIPPWASWAGPYTLVQTEFSTQSEALNAPIPRGVIEISTDNGGNGNDYGSGAATYARFSAAGDPVNPATQAVTAGGTPYTANVYIPEGADYFEDIYGRNPSGTWTIVVADDDTAGNAGTLVSWRITYAPVAASNLYAHLGAANDPGRPIARGQAGQVLGQFRLDAVGAAANDVTSIVFRESAATNLNGLLTAAALYRDNNGDGLLDGGDTLLDTTAPGASPNITFNFAQPIAADSGVDLLLTGTVAAAPAPVSMQMEIQTAASITSPITEAGLFPRRAGPRPFVSATTFTYRPSQPDLITDNTDTGITRSITVPPTSDRINSLRVGIRLNHTFDADLDFYLVPPGITWDPPYSVPNNGPVVTAPPEVVMLSTDNGGGGNNYGVDLTPYTYTYARFSGANDPTWATATAITAGGSPFTAVAHYRPEGLTAWNLSYNGDPSGTWTLIAVDAWGQDVGYLISWQLEYVPITTPQFWANVGNNNMPGAPATTGTAGNVFGQLELSSYNGANSVTQVVAREVNGFNIGNNLSAISLYRDVNGDGLFDGGDTLVDVGAMAGAVATFAIAPAFNVASNTTENLIIVGTVLGSPANTALSFQLATNADIVGSTSEIAPYPLQFGAHPLNAPYTYVSTPPTGISIPSNNANGITDTITIPATNDNIGALRIGLRIDHPNDSDLDIWLIPPGVTWAGPYTVINNGANVTPPAGVIQVSTDNGGTGNDYGTGSSTFVYTVVSRNGDRQFNTGNTPITGGGAPFTAASGYFSEGTAAFNALYGTNPGGDWTIAIADDTAGNQGRLISWFVQYVPGERAEVFSTPAIGVSDFGSVIVGSPSAAQGFRVQNMGNFSLTLPAPAPANGIRVTGANAADFVIQGVAPSGALAAGASTATFNIVFTPGAPGLRTASITVTWNTSDATMPPSLTSNYAITGTGVQPLIEVREVNIGGVIVSNGQAAANGRAFGNQDTAAGPTAALTIVVRNIGTAAMTVGVPALAGANPGDFVLNTTGYLTSIAAGSSTSFTVAFDPTTLGLRGATVTFTHNGQNTGSPFTFGVDGTGVQPTVTVASSGSPSETGPTAGTFTITGAPAPGIARTVNFTMSGLASVSAGVDYTLSGADLISYAAGSGTLNLGVSGTAVITLTPNNDAAIEALESATLTIVAGANYTVGAPASATLNIADNDSATVNVAASGSPSEAGPTAGSFTISTPNTLEVPLTINFSMSGVAVAADYALGGAASFAFPNGTATLPVGVAPSVVVTLTPVNDAFVEGPETAIMTLGAGVQYSVGASPANHSIADNDTATVTMSAAGAPNETGPVNGTYTVTVTPQPRNAMSVNISLSGSAQFGAGFDYTIGGAAITTPAGGSGPWVGTVNIPAGGGASVGVIITLQTLNDARVEATETATLAVTADSVATDPAYTGSPSQARSILDNDTATVNVSFAGSPSEAGPTAGTFTISTAATLEVALVVNFTMSGAAVAADFGLAGATTFAFPNGTATLPVGVGPSVVLTLTPVDDAFVEGAEDATLTISGGGQVVVGTASQTHTIADNDAATLTVSAGGAPAEGSAAVSSFTVSTTATLAVPLTVNFTLSGLASTVNGTDYTLAGFATYAGPSGTLTLPAGVAPSVSMTFTVINDAFVEGPEDVIFTLDAGTYNIGAPGSGSRSITDDDTSAISITLGGTPSETGPVNGTYTITATPAPVRDMLVDFAMSGTASFAAGGDYTLSGAASFSQISGLGSVIIGVGGSAVITLNVVNDAIVEASETATLSVTADSVATDPAYTGTPAQSHTIADNDQVTVTVTSSGSPSEAGPTAGSFTIQSANTLETPVTVSFSMSGVAQNGVDYNLAGSGTLPVGTNTQAIITLTPVDDSRVEATENAQLTLLAGAQVIVGAPANATLNITDNDIATVTVTAAGTPAESGSVTGTYTLSTADTLDVPVTVSFLMSGAAATAPGTDYNLSGAGVGYTGPGGTAVLPAGVGSSVVVTLTPVNDARVEANEAATLTVQTAGQAQAGAPASDTLTITDDDVAVITVTPSGTPSESGATGDYLVATGATLEIALTVNFTMSGAAVGADYALGGTAGFVFPNGSVTLPIGTGSSASVTLTPANDALVEGPEDATLTVTAGAQYTGTPNGTLTIADNDTVVITISAIGAPSESGPTAATFRVTATPQPAVAMSVNLSLSGAATFGAGFDYTVGGATITTGAGGAGPWVGTVTIPGGGAGSTFVDVTITPLDDARVEANEAVNLDITADTVPADPAYSGTPSDTLTIADNDTASVSVTSSGAAAEPGTSATYIIQSASTLDVPVTVTFTMSGTAQAVPGGDYNLSNATFTGPGGTAVLPVGTNTQVIVTLTPVNEAIVEATEDATLTVLTAGQVTAAAPTNATLNISDDDTATVNVSFAGSPSEAGPTAGTFTLSTASTLEVALTVNFTMSGSASTAPGTDYNLAGGTFVGPGGSAVLPIGAAPNVVLTLTPIDDAFVEGGETATLTISGGGQVVVGTASQTHTIADNDVPTVTVTASGTPAEGSAALGTFTIATAATLAVPLTVNFTLSGLASTASGTDYTLAGFATYTNPTGTVILPAGVAPSVNVTFSVINDAFVEGPESVIMTLNAGLYTVGGAGFDTLSITDNDTATITMLVAGAPHETGPVNGTYTVRVTPQPRHVMSVNLELTGSAQFGAAFDYAIAGATITTAQGGSGPWVGTLSVPAGTGAFVDVLVTLQTQDDALAEPTESATLTVTADTLATDPAYSGTPAQTLNITDNDLAEVFVTGGPFNFGNTEIGTNSAPSSYTVSGINLVSDIVITPPAQFEVALAAGGPWVASLNLTPASGTVSATSIFVRFAPTALGAASGDVTNASTGAATQNVAVSGLGAGITISTTALSFGSQLVGTATAAQSYFVAADGLSANLLLNAPASFELSLSGSGPWSASLNLGLGPVASTQIFVRFAPSAPGAASGDVSNASTGYITRNVAVDGTGTAGLLGISGAQSFGAWPVTTTSTPIIFTVTNTVAAGPNAAPLTVNSVTLGGTHLGDFALSAFSTGLPTALAPGASFTFEGRFTPTAQGARMADIIINSNTGGEPATNVPYAIDGVGSAALFAAAPTFPGQVDTGGPVVVSCVISAIANTTADVTVEYIGGAQASWTPATIVRTNAGAISGNVITGMGVLAAGSTLEIYIDFYATERHITASNYQVRFTPQNVIYGTGTTGTSATFNLSRLAGWATHAVPTDMLTGRFGHASVFDAANDRLIVFGGKAENANLNDVWAHDFSGYTPGWHKLNVTGTPPAARLYSTAVYDAPNQRMLLFGGWSGVRLNDLWALSLTRGSEAWTPLAPAGGPPAARYFQSLVLDEARDRAIMFGGVGNSGNLGDIWTLDLTTVNCAWAPLATTGTGPTARFGAQMAVDAPRDRLVLFSGDTGSGTPANDLFALDLLAAPAAWSTLAPLTPSGAPAPRLVATCGYAANREAMLVDGGYTSGFTFLTDAWLLDLSGTPTWTPLPQDVAASQGRCHGTADFDAARGRFTLFGGLGRYGTVQESLAFLDTAGTPAWSVPAPPAAAAASPTARWGSSMIFDSAFGANGRVLLFGGVNASNRYNDVWWTDPASASPVWTRLSPTGTPPAPRAFSAAVYNSTPGFESLVVFGGLGGYSTLLGDVWVLDLSNPGSESWSQLSPGAGPSARYLAAAAFDPNGGAPRMLVHGGLDSARRADLWALSLSGTPAWTQLTVASGPTPAARMSHGATFDTANGRFIIYYGNCTGGYLQDTWAYSVASQTWANISQSVGTLPVGRENFPCAPAAGGLRAYMHAGFNGTRLSDLWQLDIPASGTVTWTQVSPTGGAPMERYNHSACVTPANRFVMGFGYIGVSANLGGGDLWIIDPLAGTPMWQQLGGNTMPRGIEHAAYGFDATNRRLVAFGGLLEGVLDSRMWQLNLASPIAQWSPLVSVTATRPAPRRSAKFVHDPVGNRLLMYGGYLGTTHASICTELWQLTLTPGAEAWTQLSVAGGPPGLAEYSVVYDSLNQTAIFFGGQLVSGAGSNDTWTLSLSGTPAWTASTAVARPFSRQGHSAVYDPLGQRMLMFGGFAGNTAGVGDLWSYNIAADTWTAIGLASTPSARYYHTAVYDSTAGQERMLLFGGYSNAARNDLWALDLRSGFPLAWTQLGGTVAQPQPRWAHAAAFDTVGLRTVIAGGYTNGENPVVDETGFAEVWFYGR